MRSSGNSRKLRTSKHNDDNLPPSISTTLYSRSSSQIVKPSIKLDFDSWTYSYTPKVQQYWRTLYLPLLEEETKSKFGDAVLAAASQSTALRNGTRKSTMRGSKTSGKKKSKSKQKKRRRDHADSAPAKTMMASTGKKAFPYLLNSICKSLHFGMFNIQCSRDEHSGKESDILTFYFTISFQTNFRNTYLLRLKYLCDEVVTAKDDSSGSIEDAFLSYSQQKRTRNVQITCDWDYAAINRIINNDTSEGTPVSPRRAALRESNSMCLPAEILVSVFEYVKPSKFLALYSCQTNQTDLDAVDVNKLDQKHFNLSNIGWISNYFGLRSSYFIHLFKVLINFLEHPDVSGYVEKEKRYNRQWHEWREAQAELNTLNWSDSE